MRANCNGLRLETPAGWSDASLFMFNGPAATDPGLPTLSRVEAGVTPNLVIRREQHPRGAAVLEEIAENHGRELSRQTRATLVERFEVDLELGPGTVKAIAREYEVVAENGQPATQLQLFFAAQGFIYSFVGTAPRSPSPRQLFVGIARSLRLDPEP